VEGECVGPGLDGISLSYDKNGRDGGLKVRSVGDLGVDVRVCIHQPGWLGEHVLVVLVSEPLLAVVVRSIEGRFESLRVIVTGQEEGVSDVFDVNVVGEGERETFIIDEKVRGRVANPQLPEEHGVQSRLCCVLGEHLLSALEGEMSDISWSENHSGLGCGRTQQLGSTITADQSTSQHRSSGIL